MAACRNPSCGALLKLTYAPGGCAPGFLPMRRGGMRQDEVYRSLPWTSSGAFWVCAGYAPPSGSHALRRCCFRGLFCYQISYATTYAPGYAPH